MAIDLPGMIAGSYPQVGDQLYDIMWGTGSVTKVEPDYSFSLSFSAGRTVRYTTGGYYNSVRRVYWADPVIAEPPKDLTQWYNLKKLTQAAATIYGGTE